MKIALVLALSVLAAFVFADRTDNRPQAPLRPPHVLVAP
jgi:hypothetical protein